MEAFSKRQRELLRQSNVAAVEAASIAMEIGEMKLFMVSDLQEWQRIRTRLSRLTDYEFETEKDGYNLTVKRTA